MAPVLRWVLRWYGAAGFVVDLKNVLILGCTGALPWASEAPAVVIKQTKIVIMKRILVTCVEVLG